MRVVQQLQRLGLQAMNDVLLAPQERMTMQTAVHGVYGQKTTKLVFLWRNLKSLNCILS